MLQEIKRERHPYKLPPRDIRAHEMKIPTPKTAVLGLVKIRVVLAAGVRVMFAVLMFESREGKKGIAENTKRAAPIIHAFVARGNEAVHAVVRGNKKAGV